ncbi:probable palmitoyltransferase ZDHHC24 [Agrilus planipennis]|uniref:Palmitoyltransferase n=1 Tax=Agrilus planipennis TaxID=224129 RepID=A0A1W4XIZ8_AGRPL|nr:probable palmitoyltransferase ZDHHC24 [Agrilus planipennis]
MIRVNVLPRTIRDACVTSFLLVMVPLTYWFELFVVFPVFFKPWGLLYIIHIGLSLFLLFNIISNFFAIVFTDTSIRGRMISTKLDPEWRFCYSCESVAPPRSWHCSACDTCILKRDHHCMFTSCCIGHFNHRYFFMFIFYIFISLAYCLVYNTLYFWNLVEFRSWMTIVKLLFPLATLFIDNSLTQLSLFLYLLLTLSTILCGVLLYYHGDLMLKGKVNHERKSKDSKYNQGRKRNVTTVLGERWHLVWISPFIESKLPGDGINWTVTENHKTQ